MSLCALTLPKFRDPRSLRSFIGEITSNAFETRAEPIYVYGTKLRLPDSLLNQMPVSVTERR